VYCVLVDVVKLETFGTKVVNRFIWVGSGELEIVEYVWKLLSLTVCDCTLVEIKLWSCVREDWILDETSVTDAVDIDNIASFLELVLGTFLCDVWYDDVFKTLNSKCDECISNTFWLFEDVWTNEAALVWTIAVSWSFLFEVLTTSGRIVFDDLCVCKATDVAALL